MLSKIGFILSTATCMSLAIASMAQNIQDLPLAGCLIECRNDTLVVENERIKRLYAWNGGNLITLSIENKVNGYLWHTSDQKTPDMSLPGQSIPAKPLSFRIDTVAETDFHFPCLTATIEYALDELQIKRVIRLYPDCPAIASDFYFKGKPAKDWFLPAVVRDSLTDVRFVRLGKARGYLPVMERAAMEGKHWRYRIVELFEMTDHLNDLVREYRPIGFFERIYQGNILFAENIETRQGLFFLKEAPSAKAQTKYCGGDYLTAFGQIRMIGFGIDGDDLSSGTWTQGYSSVTGVFDKTEYDALASLKNYQDKIRKRDNALDEMVMMNTWGDYSDATKNINQKYILEELERCSQLGISHYQLDYGWQSDRETLKSYPGKAENYRDNEYYWLPDKNRFPNGFKTIVQKAKRLGIELCLWFEPNYNDNYRNWAQDADWLIRLNRLYGIRTFKVDGLRIHNKQSEERVDSLFIRLSDALHDNVCINLDVTADKRFGYLFKNRYGNIFLENRYTDWSSYYPYQTLRNLWMLSKYVPTRNIQLEFLNKWRNREKYHNDRYAPENYDLEYLFAITMMAQPLAWMHAHNLPKEGFLLGPVIQKYRKYQRDIHNGMILPIGDEPSGTSWTGFQSIRKDEGFFLLFREHNSKESSSVKTWLQPDVSVELTHILGEGADFTTKTNKNGEIAFNLKAENSYALFRYKVLR